MSIEKWKVNRRTDLWDLIVIVSFGRSALLFGSYILAFFHGRIQCTIIKWNTFPPSPVQYATILYKEASFHEASSGDFDDRGAVGRRAAGRRGERAGGGGRVFRV